MKTKADGSTSFQPQELKEHNRFQRSYFERSVKSTMRPTPSRYLERQVNEILKFTNLRPGERVLEVGCGMGRYTLLLAEKGIRVEGLDFSSILLDRLEFYNGGRFKIPLHCADLQQSQPQLEDLYDVVVGFFTLHHIKDLKECFRTLKKLLRPGGRVVFLEPNPYNFLYYLQILLTPGMTWKGDRGILQMRKNLIFNAMERAGLTRLQMTRFGFFPPFLANQSWGRAFEKKLEGFPLWGQFLPFQLFKGERHE